ncbi:MAG: FAD-dependent oxidoreductase [Pseudomonadota bacterium]
MKVAVIGGGVVGTLTAHFLNCRGCQVTLIDAGDEPASQTSRANGGQLSYTFCDAMADPQLLSKLPGIMLGTDPAFRIRPSLRADFIRWGLSFLNECRSKRRDTNTMALLSLAGRSSELMRTFKDQFRERAAFSEGGKLVLLSQPVDQEMRRRIELKTQMGLEISILNQNEILDIEPTLATLRQPPAAAIFSPKDEAANAHLFTKYLAEHLGTTGVDFRYGELVREISPRKNGECRIKTDKAEEVFNAIVLATGDGAASLLRPHNLILPVLGMSGYSWTFPATEGSPSTSITALSKRIVYSRLGDVIRVAGFADVNLAPIVGKERANTLRSIASQFMPGGADYDNPIGDWWQGVRAMTPNSQPILGRTGLPGVYTNLGHGMLGWTLGAATSEFVAQEITKNES